MRVPRIGMTEKAIGRLGNHLFQYNFLAQLSHHFEVEMFHREFLGNCFFENLEGKCSLHNRIPFRSIKYSRHEIESIPWQEFLGNVSNHLHQGKQIVLPPGLMGNRFFDATMINPRELFELRSSSVNLLSNFRTDSRIRVGIHFRGTDYEAWDANAVMGAGYYLASLEYLSTRFDLVNAEILLITDDPHHDTCLQILKHWKVKLGSAEDAQSDFFNLSQCDYIISSPSSFVFWASFFGKQKKMIYSKKWMDYKIGQGDIFWTRLRENTNSFHVIEEEI
jgi:hypothetical protein